MAISYKKIKAFVWINGIVSRFFYPFLKIIDHRKQNFSDQVILKESQPITIDFSNYHSRIKAYWSDFKTFQSVPFFYIKVIRARIISKGMILNEKNQVILESTIFQKEYLQILNSNHLIFLKRFLPTSNRKKVISLLNKLDNNYFHWTLEALPRILLVCDQPFFKEYKILIKKDARHFIQDSLHFLFDIPKEQIISKSLGQHLIVEEALVVSYPHIRDSETQWTNVYVPEIIRKLNERAHAKLQQLKIDTSRFPKNILISRKDAIARRILNESELLDALKDSCFVPIVLEEYSFQDQVSLFANAEKIIALHGAGITNVIYAKNPILVEIFPEERNIRDAFYFAQITAALKIEHHLLSVKTKNKNEDVILNSKKIAEIKNILKITSPEIIQRD